jgi:hypothetical protein
MGETACAMSIWLKDIVMNNIRSKSHHILYLKYVKINKMYNRL